MKRTAAILFAAAFIFAACEPITPDPEIPDTPDPEIPDTPQEPQLAWPGGVIVLNNGNMGSNDASVAFWNSEKSEVTPNLFLTANGQKLGDLGQDIAVCGDMVFISVNNSRTIFVTDKHFNIVKEIKGTAEFPELSPRYFAVDEDKVYVTFYEGYLGEIDCSNDCSLRVTAVGSYPEGLCISKGMAYVANSGYGYENTVSVVDLASFSETEKISVNRNPQFVVADTQGENLYVCSWDSYDPATWAVDSPAKLERVKLADGSVTDLEIENVKSIVAGDNNMMYIATGGYDENWQVKGSIGAYDMTGGSYNAYFLSEDISNYYSLSYCKGTIAVGASDYVNYGDVYLYGTDGKRTAKFDSQGLNPQKVIIF